MRNDWKRQRWGDIATLEYGKALREYNIGKYPVYGTNGPIGYHNDFLFAGPGIIIGRKGAYRGVHYCSKPFFVIDTAFFLKPKTKFDMRWAYYALKTQDINAIDSGSAIPSTSRESFYALPVYMPPLSAQRSIASILGSLDDKIELNRATCATLEEMARVIFKSWFVDFDPVRAKAAGEKPEAICKRLGLTREVLDLFPDRLVDSELGEIPEGWEVAGLDSLVDLSTVSVSPSSEPEKHFEHYSIPAFDMNRMPLFEVGVSIKSNKYKVFPQSILVSKLNPETKRVWLPFTNNDRAICSTEFMQFVPRDKEKRAFLYYLLASDKMQEEILMRVTGSTGSRQRAQPSLIATLPVVVPKEKLQTLYSILTFPQLIMINKLQVESKHLAEIRDSLLPKLISGEIEVPVEVGA